MPDTTGFSSGVTLKAFTMKMEVKQHAHGQTNAASHINKSCLSLKEVLDAKCEAPDEVTPPGEPEILSVNSLRRSVSQVMDGKSVTGDEDAWDPNISGHDSGMVSAGTPAERRPRYRLVGFHTAVSCLSVHGRRGVRGHRQRLQHGEEGAHHVHRHQPVSPGRPLNPACPTGFCLTATKVTQLVTTSLE